MANLVVELEVFREYRNFVVKSKLRDRKDTGGIFDNNMELLASFRHEHTWRTPRGPVKIAKQARATDIYLERVDGALFGEINEVPPKLFSMRLIRTFEIYDDKKELVGMVREKPKAFGSDWVLENLEKKVIASALGERKKKDYEIQSSSGQVLAKCFRDSSLAEDSYKVDIFGGGIDLFLVLSYIVVLDLAKTGWATREGLLFSKTKKEKEHLVKTQLVEAQAKKAQASGTISKYAIRNAVLSVMQAGLFFTLATLFLESSSGTNSFMGFPFSLDFVSLILYGLGVAILVTAFLGVSFVKLNQFNQVAMLMGAFGVFSLFIGSVMLSGGFVSLASESTILVVGMMIVGFGILANLWLLMGLFDDFIKK